MKRGAPGTGAPAQKSVAVIDVTAESTFHPTGQTVAVSRWGTAAQRCGEAPGFSGVVPYGCYDRGFHRGDELRKERENDT